MLFQFRLNLKSLLIALTLVGLSSCGGGSGNNTPASATPDTKNPFITSTIPGSEVDNFDPSLFVKVIFNEEIAAVDTDQVFIQKFIGSILDVDNNIALKQDEPFEFDSSSKTLIIKSKINALQSATKYQVTIQNIKDRAGNQIAKSCQWVFATSGYGSISSGKATLCEVTDTGNTATKLQVTKISINDNQNNVRIDVPIKIQFNFDVASKFLSKQYFTLQPDSTYKIDYFPDTFTVQLTPNNLIPNTNYSLLIDANIQSSNNLNLDQATTVAFTTLPITKYVIIAHRDSNSVSVYSMNENNGVSSLIAEHTNTTVYAGNAVFNNLTSINTTTQGPWLYTTSATTNSVQALQMDISGGLTALSQNSKYLNYSVQDRPFMAVTHPSLPYLYVPSSTDAADAPKADNLNSYIHVFQIQTDGSLNEVGSTKTDIASNTNTINTRTAYPSIVKIHPNGNYLFATDFQGSVLSTFRIDQATGQLTEIAGSPFTVVDNAADGSNAVSQTLGITISPDGNLIYVSNFSSAYTYTVNNTMITASSISALAFDQTNGQITRIGTPFITGKNPYEMAISPDGKHLYVALFGENDGQNNAQIARYLIQADGSLCCNNISNGFVNVTLNPATIRIDPSNRFLLVGHLGTMATVEIFYIQPLTNNLIPVNQLTALSPRPFAITFMQ